jgi:hypothetical protein
MVQVLVAGRQDGSQGKRMEAHWRSNLRRQVVRHGKAGSQGNIGSWHSQSVVRASLGSQVGPVGKGVAARLGVHGQQAVRQTW